MRAGGQGRKSLPPREDISRSCERISCFWDIQSRVTSSSSETLRLQILVKTELRGQSQQSLMGEPRLDPQKEGLDREPVPFPGPAAPICAAGPPALHQRSLQETPSLRTMPALGLSLQNWPVISTSKPCPRLPHPGLQC